MENYPYLHIIKKYWYKVLVIILLFMAISLVLSAKEPPKFRSRVKLLVIQKTEKTDPLTALKSANKLALNLASLIPTNSFFERVLESGFKIKNNFPKSEIVRRKVWEKKIKTEVVPETGILEIEVYDEDLNQAQVLAHAISYVLITHGQDYHGGGNEVIIKTLDPPLTSENPVQPNIPLNLGIGALLGALTGGGLVLLKESGKATESLSSKNREIETKERLKIGDIDIEAQNIYVAKTKEQVLDFIKKEDKEKEEEDIHTMQDHYKNS